MKKMIYILLFMFGQMGWSQSDQFTAGNDHYEAGEYDQAIEKYGALASEGYHAAELYYNLGNAHYRKGEIGKAIWAYESALKIKPNHQDALHNLEFANAQTVDKIDTQRHGFGHWLSGIFFSVGIHFWVIVSVSCSLLFTIMAFFFIKSTNKRNRSLLFISSSLLGICFIITVVAAYFHKNHITQRNNGVIITQQVDVLLSPTEDGKVSYKLSEGAKVELISEEKDWVQINLNGNQGWIQKKDLWEI